MKTVKFTTQWGSYNKGDIAGFEAKTANKLIKSKVATAYTAPKAEQEKEPVEA